jgi:hypothetical protein
VLNHVLSSVYEPNASFSRHPGSDLEVGVNKPREDMYGS